MTPWTKTALCLVAAGAAVGLVVISRPASRQLQLISDQGTPLTPDLKNPLDLRSLEVISYDEQAVKVRAFKVESDGKNWKIPSAFNYPADAQEGVAKAASAFTGIVRERFVSDNKNDFAKYGVIDPTDEASLATNNRGTKVTFRDAAGKSVVDVIIGKPVDASEPGAQVGPRKRYIREAGKNRTHVTTIDGAFSTKFVDWVETDLLKLTADKVKVLEVDRYNIDEQTGKIKNPTTLKLSRNRASALAADGAPPAPAAWTGWDIAAEPPPGGPSESEKIENDRITGGLTALSQLKIVGVQPKPANLVKALSKAENSVALDVNDQLSLRKHGFFIAQQLGLVANEGTLTVTLDDGVVYQLMLGELASEADAAAAGGQVGGDGAAKRTDAKALGNETVNEAANQAADQTANQAGNQAGNDVVKDESKEPKKTDARFVMVIANFNDAAIPVPSKTAQLFELEAKEQAELPNLTDETKAALEPLRRAYQDKVDARAKAVAEGKKRADELAARFAAWYYLVDLKSLGQIRPTRDEVVVKKDVGPGTAPPSLPTMPMPLQVPGQ